MSVESSKDMTVISARAKQYTPVWIFWFLTLTRTRSSISAEAKTMAIASTSQMKVMYFTRKGSLKVPMFLKAIKVTAVTVRRYRESFLVFLGKSKKIADARV